MNSFYLRGRCSCRCRRLGRCARPSQYSQPALQSLYETHQLTERKKFKINTDI